MTVLAQSTPESDTKALGTNERIIRWGSGPVAFELQSPDADIIGAARRVFGRWLPFDGAPVQGRWQARWLNDTIIVEPRRASDDGSELPHVSDAEHAVAEVEYAAMWQIVESCDHVLCFHAALMSKDGKGVAIVGPSHAGKSTLATGLWQNGWRFHCDDLTMIVEGKALAGPRRVALRKESRAQVGDALWDQVSNTDGYFKSIAGCLFQPMDIDQTFPETVDLSAIFFLKRSGAAHDGGPKQLARAHAAIGLLPYTNVVRTRSFSAALAPAAELMEKVPAWDLPRAPLSDMISSVERLALAAYGDSSD